MYSLWNIQASQSGHICNIFWRKANRKKNGEQYIRKNRSNAEKFFFVEMQNEITCKITNLALMQMTW